MNPTKNKGVSKKMKKPFTILTDKKKAQLKKIVIDPKEVKKLFENGLDTWEITEKLFDFPFEHGDRRTWFAYARVRNIIRDKRLKEKSFIINPNLKNLLSEYIKAYSEEKLADLINSVLRKKEVTEKKGNTKA